MVQIISHKPGEKVKAMTLKQANLARILDENTETTLGQAMVRAGYSPKSATSPKKVLESKSFQEIFANSISDKMVLSAHKKLLKAKVKVRTYIKGEMKTEVVQEDTLGLSKGVELAYKVKGAFAPLEQKITFTGLEAKSDDELEEILKADQAILDRHRKHRIIEGELANDSETVEK